MYNTDELKLALAARLDVYEVFDILGWEMLDFLDAIEDHVEENRDDFEDALRETEE